MLELRHITEHLEDTRQRLSTRGGGADETLSRLAELADIRRQRIAETESLRAERNDASKAMASLPKDSDDFAQKRAALKALGDRIKSAESETRQVESEVSDLLLHIPNLPHESVPQGKGEDDNPVRRVWGDKPSFDFQPKDHIELARGLGIVDFERAAKVSGARFAFLRGDGARLERALMQFMLDRHVDEHGYEELWPPALVRDTALLGTGQLPKFATDAFEAVRHYDEGDDTERVNLYLSPTAEVQITNFLADEILDGSELPRAFCAFSPCFRSEAGSYGRDTRGLIRQHQFDKVELVRFATPEQAPDELEALTGHAEAILQALGLHYRVSELCTGDLGFSSQKTYDLEVWLPGQGAYREISSCSWFGDFQARRAKIRYRSEKKAKPRPLHTLNGSGLAIGRTWVAVLEQYQRADGSVRIPEALRPYMQREELTSPT